MFQRRFTTPRGLALVGDVGGSELAPVVVLMHGGGQTRHSWSGAMTALIAKGYRVINYDARGHGDSDWCPQGDYDLDDRVADLEAVLAGVGDRYALVGASMGGATALHGIALGLRPRALVLVDIVPEAEIAGIVRITSFMRGNQAGFATVEEAAAAVAAYNPERPRPPDNSGLMRNLRRSAEGRFHWHWDPKILSETPDAHHRKLREAAQTVSEIAPVPMLLVRGLRSDVVSDASVERFRKVIPWLDVVNVAGAGHMVAGDRNDAFNAGATDFLTTHMPVGAVDGA